jgi:hypothetical protein
MAVLPARIRSAEWRDRALGVKARLVPAMYTPTHTEATAAGVLTGFLCLPDKRIQDYTCNG